VPAYDSPLTQHRVAGAALAQQAAPFMQWSGNL